MTQKARGVFLNQPQAQCSIYESGCMVYRALQHGEHYDLDYFALSPETAQQIPPADFYLFNYHHATMAWLDTKSLASLPGKKITVVLEMLPGNPFVYVSPEHFDAYLVMDPTMNVAQANVYGFPRPLEEPPEIRPYVEKEIPWIGTFGFSTPGKGFELVVDAVNREFDRARVRINIPPGTFADNHAFRMHRRSFADYLTDLCRAVAKPGIEVEVTREFMSKEQLIDWCGQNTLNCFLYCRNQPGLSATTDQCITVGRPLAVSANETFRHLHQYIKPYPERGLREAIATSVPGVLQMREDWTPKNFSRRFEQVLGDLGLVNAPGNSRWKRPAFCSKEAILVLNRSGSHSGEALFVETAARALDRSTRFSAKLETFSTPDEVERLLKKHNARAVVAVDPPALSAPCIGLDLSTPERVLPLNCNEQPVPEVPTVGGYFLGPDYSLCEQLISRVSRDFGSAQIILYLPDSGAPVHAIAQHLQDQAPDGITLQFVHERFPADKLLALMGYPSINFFPGVSKEEQILVDYALAVQRPLAVGDGPMFDHLESASPSIRVRDRSLKAILETGLAPLVPFYNDFSEARFLLRIEKWIDSAVTANRAAKVRDPGARPSLNRVLDSGSANEFNSAFEKLHRLASEIISRKLPEQILARAFVLDTVERYASGRQHPRILAVGGYADPVCTALESQGYSVDVVDPLQNFDLDTFYSLPTTALESYDIVLAPSVLEHVDDDVMFVAQIGDLLSPGGVAVLTCPFASDGHPAGRPFGHKSFTAEDFEQRFISALQGCAWADAPRWEAPAVALDANIATLVIVKSGAQA